LIKTTLEILQKDRCGKGKKISLLDFILATDLTNQIRNQLNSEFISDPSFRIPLEDYSLEEFQGKRVSRGTSSFPGSRGCTTHVSVLDCEGNGVSVTTSNGEGSGFFIPNTGIMLNNMLGEEDINPKGFHLYPPGTRLPSMMSPTVILKDGIPALITGTAGSNRIRSAIIQLLIHHLCHQVEIQAATELPRLHLEGSKIEAEPGVNAKEIRELKNIYHIQQWQEKNLFFGGINSVTPDSGGADSRRGGACKTFEIDS
jgi:gamma-glutamyltranspeptidase/glutathione hydrolase